MLAYFTAELGIKLSSRFSSREAVGLRLNIRQNGVYALCKEASEKFAKMGSPAGIQRAFFCLLAAIMSTKKTAVIHGGLLSQSE
ncbi:hypothetical protein YA28_14935 [Klebsiella aerogenes]|nr:hypothetical protein YA28_14935 [Klebsiella aerogenes]KUQ25878.1 hypothetical protein AWI09_22030 [Klebsiella aerogenes]KUR22664.1 hypothetical protein AWI35_21550 [Klebsiella aerogenes]